MARGGRTGAGTLVHWLVYPRSKASGREARFPRGDPSLSGTAGCPYLQGWGWLWREALPGFQRVLGGVSSPNVLSFAHEFRARTPTLSPGPAPSRLNPCSAVFDPDDKMTTVTGHRRVALTLCQSARAPPLTASSPSLRTAALWLDVPIASVPTSFKSPLRCPPMGSIS